MLGLTKFLHLFALMLGAAAGFGSLIVARRIAALDGPPPPALAGLRPIFARTGLAGITLIWITGLVLYAAKYGDADLGPLYWLKLAVAASLLCVVVALNVIGTRAARAGTPPPSIMQPLSVSSTVLTLIALALAVAIFG